MMSRDTPLGALSLRATPSGFASRAIESSGRPPQKGGGQIPFLTDVCTAEDQLHYDKRWPILQKIPATVRFISYEPALGPLQLFRDPAILTGLSAVARADHSISPWTRIGRGRCNTAANIMAVRQFPKIGRKAAE
jgi:Protein of unknown function (DUF5131)